MGNLSRKPWNPSFTLGDLGGAVLLSVKENYTRHEQTRQHKRILKRWRDARYRARVKRDKAYAASLGYVS